MITIINDYIKNNKDEWCDGALEQVEKIRDLVSGEDKKFTCNNDDYAIYYVDERVYGEHEGKVFTFDTEVFNSDALGFFNFWVIPTVEGVFVDIWLIK